MEYKNLRIDFTPDCGPNEGGYYCQVYRRSDDLMLDDFCVHPDELPADGDPEKAIRQYMETQYESYKLEGLLDGPRPVLEKNEFQPAAGEEEIMAPQTPSETPTAPSFPVLGDM